MRFLLEYFICFLICLVNESYSIIPDVVDWTNISMGVNQENFLYSQEWAESVGFHRTTLSTECIDNGTVFYQATNTCRCPLDSYDRDNSSSSRVCVNKCCAVGFSFSQTLLKCVPSELSFNPRPILRDGKHQVVNTTEFIIRKEFWNCSDRKTYVWSSKSQHRTSMSIMVETGKLFIPQVWIRDAQFIENYCIDNFLSSDGSSRIKALVCGEPDQYSIVTFMTTLLPWLFVVSAIFMLLTFAIYCTKPTLRRTMHGFTLCCHLVSMAIHFVGLAVIYSNIVVLTPTTCLLFGAVVHFFNISSFTWITVMGFDTWRKLKSSEAGTNRKGNRHISIHIRKSCCYSVYAWGLPFIIVTVCRLWESYSFRNDFPDGDIRDTLAFYGQRIRLCWYSYDYIKEMVFVNGPLVVLLLGNLFFFIPSAVFVYRSGKFATKSASSNSKLEKQRLRAIFRLFILMEFHAIPCLLRFLSITMGVKVAIYIHVLEIVFNASSGLFLFVNFAWKPHFLPWLRFQFHTKLSIMFEYVGRKYSFSSSSLPRNVNNHSDVSNSTSTSSISVQLTKCRNFEN